jgi:hypothetical protein
MQDSTFVFLTEKIEQYAGLISGKVQEVAPVVYAMVRQRVMVESILMIAAPLVCFIALIILTLKLRASAKSGYLKSHKTLEYFDSTDCPAPTLCGVASVIALVVFLVIGITGILNLLSLDYVTVARILEMAR